MEYVLKDLKTGKKAVYPTKVCISEEGGRLTFTFYAEHTTYNCPYDYYNAIHSRGDACEILIGNDPARKVYYEIEITPYNRLMLAKMTRVGRRLDGSPKLQIDFVEEKDCFLESSAEITENGYIARVSFDKEKIKTGEGEIYFNAYRLETDGERLNKHLFALNPTRRKFFHRPKKFVWLKDYV